MDDEEDDFYDPADSVPAPHANDNAHGAQAPQQESDDMEEEEYEVEEDDVRPFLLSLFRFNIN